MLYTVNWVAIQFMFVAYSVPVYGITILYTLIELNIMTSLKGQCGGIEAVQALVDNT